MPAAACALGAYTVSLMLLLLLLLLCAFAWSRVRGGAVILL